MQELRFDFATDNATTGFRLKSFSLYNWGTFHNRIVTMELDGHNALLTGDIGSGKSTIADAITTLLVPPNKIVFNKAAGANARERNLLSYVLGEYKTAKDEQSERAKPKRLRDESSFSVLAAVFYNEGFDEYLSLASFMYVRNNTVQRFFVTSKVPLDIKTDLFESDVKLLKRELKQKEHTQVYESFSEYAKDFKRAMGIKNDQALNLFYQSVSLKSIDNLTDFMRYQMLEKSDIDEKIGELCSDFAELSHLHKLVMDAKEQIEILSRLKKRAKSYKEAQANYALYGEMVEKIENFLAAYRIEQKELKLGELQRERTKSASMIEKLQKEKSALQETLDSLRMELNEKGGGRLKEIQKELVNLEERLKERQEVHKSYSEMLKALGKGVVSNEHAFLKMQEELLGEYDSIEQRVQKLQNEAAFDTNALQKYTKELDEVEADIIYYQNNPSNIDKPIAAIRDKMAEQLGIAKEALPFVGEHLKVIDEAWSGAIERTLRSAALELLVDERYYEDVSRYVNQTNLKGKLVFRKVGRIKANSYRQIGVNSLITKLQIKPDSPFYEEIEELLLHRFDIPCVESIEELQRLPKALTITGMLKLGEKKHIKDDRYDIEDSSRWVLGWENELKLQNLQKQKESLEQKRTYLTKKIEQTQKEIKSQEERRRLYIKLSNFEHFTQIDIYTPKRQIKTLSKEREKLLQSSDIIQTLQKEMEYKKELLLEVERKLEKKNRDIGSLETKIDKLQNEIESLAGLEQVDGTLKERFEAMYAKRIDTADLDRLQREMDEELKKLRKRYYDKKQSAYEYIIAIMNEYHNAFAIEASELDISIESLDGYLQKLRALQKDNLPRFEREFHAMLQEKTTQKTIALQQELEKQIKLIKEKIERINASLGDIEYNKNSYIQLVAKEVNDSDIKTFRSDLKNAISYSFNEDAVADEQKFLEIKKLIDRFNGREGYVEIDKKWRSKVGDVRNWFVFNAEEIDKSSGKVVELYEHSGGKSGGQKEKLAYTVLASSLAYQFGLEYDKIQSRSFRFIMIDEAFGKGSDESTRYALSLFEKLQLQLLAITPKQKIHIIEPFISSIHFVDNIEGKNSQLLSLSIEEFRNR